MAKLLSCRDWDPPGLWCGQCAAGRPEHCTDKRVDGREATEMVSQRFNTEPMPGKEWPEKLKGNMASLFAAVVMGGVILIALCGIILILKLLLGAIF